MKRLNNKGFAISTMLYGLLIIIVLVFGLILSTMAFNRKTSKEFTSKIIEELESINDSSNYYICKMATSLHSETCTADKQCSSKYNAGDTIMYGNLGTSEFKVGDAFDCDVNGDLLHDEATERFYFLGYEDSEKTKALLVYFGNVIKNGTSDSYNYNTNIGSKYNLTNNPFDSYQGPTAAIDNLPLSTIWKNTTNFFENVGYIMEETGEKTITWTSSYSERRTRLLRYNEVVSNCGNNVFNKCNFLLENTKFAKNNLEGIWLETPSSSNQSNAWYVKSNGSVTTDIVNKEYGIRPVIAIKSENIEH